MKNSKILQLIPALPGIFAQYIDESEGGVFKLPIICFALVEEVSSDGTKYQRVAAMDMHVDGIIEESNTSEFILPKPSEQPPSENKPSGRFTNLEI